MRKTYLLVLPLCLTGCSITEENGDLRAEPPPVLREQVWRVTDRVETPAGEHICTVSSGGIDVTQRGNGRAVTQQVASSQRVNPGEYYRVIVGPHIYETPDGIFSAVQTRQIIHDFMGRGVAYSELSIITNERLHTAVRRRLTNNVPLDSFPPAYDECAHFVAPVASHYRR